MSRYFEMQKLDKFAISVLPVNFLLILALAVSASYHRIVFS